MYYRSRRSTVLLMKERLVIPAIIYGTALIMVGSLVSVRHATPGSGKQSFTKSSGSSLFKPAAALFQMNIHIAPEILLNASIMPVGIYLPSGLGNLANKMTTTSHATWPRTRTTCSQAFKIASWLFRIIKC